MTTHYKGIGRIERLDGTVVGTIPYDFWYDPDETTRFRARSGNPHFYMEPGEEYRLVLADGKACRVYAAMELNSVIGEEVYTITIGHPGDLT